MVEIFLLGGKFNLDVHYVKNYFFRRLKIILKTIFVLLKEDINQSDKITMEKFEGTSPINNKK